MSRECVKCGKSQMTGHKVSHSNIKTNRTFSANLQKVDVDGSNQYLCTKCIKTLKKSK